MDNRVYIPSSWVKGSEGEKFKLPAEKVYFPDHTRKIRIAIDASELAVPIFGVVGAATFAASFYFTASILTPIALGALGLAIVAVAIRTLVIPYALNREVAIVQEHVKDWHEKNGLVAKLLEPASTDYVKTFDLGAAISWINTKQNQENQCFDAIDYLARCAIVHWDAIAHNKSIKTRNGNRSPKDLNSLRRILLEMKGSASLASKTMTSEERKYIIWLAGDLRDPKEMK
jgi:hypothetical protein